MMIHSTLSALSLNITDGKHGDCENSPTSGYYFISCKDVRDGTIHYEDARQITERDFFDAHKRTLLEPNDILITNSGTIGRMAFVTDTPQTSKTTFQKSVAIVKPNPNKIIPKYLYYVLLNSIDSFITQANGSAQKNLLLSTMRSFNLFIDDDKQVQARIASILSAYDDLIENNQKQIKLLEEAAQRLYKEWFVDLRFPGWKNTKIVDGVPEGWEKTTISSVSSVLRRGISPKYNDNAAFTVINQKCIRQTIVDFSESRKQEKTFSSEMALIDSDTVICSTGAGTLGRVGQVFGSPTNATFDSHVTLVRTNGRIGAQLLFQSLKDQQTYLQDSGKGSTNQLELSRTTIAECPVFIPSEPVSKHFEALVQPIHDLISKISQLVLLLQNSKDMMLSKLMNENTEEHHAS